MTWPHWLKHSWGPWSEPEVDERGYKIDPWLYIDSWTYNWTYVYERTRTCRTCGVSQTRRYR